MCMISLIVFTDKYQGHVQNGFSLHSNYIQIHNNKDSSWEYKHYMFNKQFFNLLGYIFTSFITQVFIQTLSTHTGHYQLPIFRCTNVHPRRYARPIFRRAIFR